MFTGRILSMNTTVAPTLLAQLPKLTFEYADA